MNKSDEHIDKGQYRKYICDIISELTHDDTIAVYRFLLTKVNRSNFCEHKNGCSINLDNISNEIIYSLYNFVVEKRNG